MSCVIFAAISRKLFFSSFDYVLQLISFSPKNFGKERLSVATLIYTLYFEETIRRLLVQEVSYFSPLS